MSDTPKTTSYGSVTLRIYKLRPGSNEWELFTAAKGVHADSGAVYNGRLWVNDQYADSILGIDLNEPKKPTIALTSPEFCFPHGVGVSPQGRLAVTNYGNSSISFVDLTKIQARAP